MRVAHAMRVPQAGPGRCALATSTSSAAAEISQNVEDLLEALYKRPLPVIKSSRPGLLIRGHVLGSSTFRFETLSSLSNRKKFPSCRPDQDVHVQASQLGLARSTAF